MKINKMYNLENYDPNDVSQPSVAPTDWRLFLAGTLALPLATIPANVELAEVQAAWGVSINQNQMAAWSAPILPRLIKRTRQGIPCFCVRFRQVDCPMTVSAN